MFSPRTRRAFEEIASTKTYLYSLAGSGARLFELMPDFTLSSGRSFEESRWALGEGEDGVARLYLLGQEKLSCVLRWMEVGSWVRRAELSGERLASAIDEIQPREITHDARS
jgi:hypothetical protein